MKGHLGRERLTMSSWTGRPLRNASLAKLLQRHKSVAKLARNNRRTLSCVLGTPWSPCDLASLCTLCVKSIHSGEACKVFVC